jgi:hypothetical protein
VARSGAGRGAPPNLELRTLNQPRPAVVGADRNGGPLTLIQGRKRLRVEAIRETWRIDDEWWRQPISRIYHTVVLEDGRAVTLYQDLLTRGWFMQG